MNSFTHLDDAGQMHMVDVGDKPETLGGRDDVARLPRPKKLGEGLPDYER